MNAFQKLFEKVKSTKSIGLVALMIILALIILVAVVSISGIILLFGLNLMGLDFPYTFKTILGAAIILFSLRPSGMFNKSKKE